jgi:hypothetical protein
MTAESLPSARPPTIDQMGLVPIGPRSRLACEHLRRLPVPGSPMVPDANFDIRHQTDSDRTLPASVRSAHQRSDDLERHDEDQIGDRKAREQPEKRAPARPPTRP